MTHSSAQTIRLCASAPWQISVPARDQERQSQSVDGTGLAENGRQMTLHRPLSDREMTRNSLVAGAHPDEPRNLDLSRREDRETPGRPGLGICFFRHEAIHQLRNERTSNPELTLQHDAHDACEHVGGSLECTHRAHAGAIQRELLVLVGLVCNRDDICTGADFQQLGDDAYRVYVREPHVEQRELRPKPGEAFRQRVGPPHLDRRSAIPKRGAPAIERVGMCTRDDEHGCPLALAQRVLLGAQHRLQQVLQYGPSTGSYVNGRLHPGDDLQVPLPCPTTALRRAYTNEVVTLRCRARTIIDNRVGAYVLDSTGETAVDREVVRRQLDHRIKPGPQEGDVPGPHTCLDQQRVVERHNFDQVHARLHDAAHRGHFHLLDRPGHGGTHRRSRQPVNERDVRCAHHRLVPSHLAQLAAGRGAKLRGVLLRPFTHFAFGGLKPRHAQARDLELTKEIVCLPLQADELYLGDDTLLRGWPGHGELLLYELIAVLQLVVAGLQLRKLLFALLGLSLQHCATRRKVTAPRFVQRLLLLNQHWVVAHQVGWRHEHSQ